MERMNACLLLQAVCRELQEARDLLIKVSETELADSAQTLYEKARCLLFYSTTTTRKSFCCELKKWLHQPDSGSPNTAKLNYTNG